MSPRLEALLNVDELAEFLNVKKSTLYSWAYRKQIPSQKVGKALRFSREDIDRWLKTQKRESVCEF